MCICGVCFNPCDIWKFLFINRSFANLAVMFHPSTTPYHTNPTKPNIRHVRCHLQSLTILAHLVTYVTNRPQHFIVTSTTFYDPSTYQLLAIVSHLATHSTLHLQLLTTLPHFLSMLQPVHNALSSHLQHFTTLAHINSLPSYHTIYNSLPPY